MSIEKEKLKNIQLTPSSYEAFLQSKAASHTNLRYYGNKKRICEIINDGILRLSDGHNWNDKYDRMLFNADEYDYVQFGKCFCFSKTESVAMWKMYAGENDGCLIDFKKQLPNIVNETTQICLKYYDGEKVLYSRILEKGDFRIILCDVLYLSANTPDTYTVKRSDERVENVPDSVIDSINGVCKNMPWCYENECRLIVRVNKSLLEGIPYNIAEIKIPPVIQKRIKKNVVTSPNYKQPIDEHFTCTASTLTGNVEF